MASLALLVSMPPSTAATNPPAWWISSIASSPPERLRANLSNRATTIPSISPWWTRSISPRSFGLSILPPLTSSSSTTSTSRQPRAFA